MVTSQSLLAEITVSPYFPPEFHNFQYDVLFLTEDFVLFYLRTDFLRRTSGKAFQSVIAQPSCFVDGLVEPLRIIPDTSDIFTVILHAVYFLPYNDRTCSFQTFTDDIFAMRRYDVEPVLHLTPDNPFYINLLSFAPVVPYELYALAAQFDIYPLAAAASSHLLSRPVTAISDELADRIGAVYLKRLLFLHRERMDALKTILLQAPNSHPLVAGCNEELQKKVIRTWALAVANLAWIARPDLSTSMIRSAFSHLEGTFSCQLCQHALDNRVEDAIVRWSNVKCTI